MGAPIKTLNSDGYDVVEGNEAIFSYSASLNINESFWSPWIDTYKYPKKTKICVNKNGSVSTGEMLYLQASNNKTVNLGIMPNAVGNGIAIADVSNADMGTTGYIVTRYARFVYSRGTGGAGTVSFNVALL